MAESRPPTNGEGTAWLPDRLARLRARAEAAKTKRASQTQCPHLHDNVELVHIFSNGSTHVFRGCSDCGRPVDGGRWLKQSPDGLPVALDERTNNPPCVRCGAFGTELHHFAPKALFGATEAELWPTTWLCSGCHNYWHRVIDGGTTLGEVVG